LAITLCEKSFFEKGESAMRKQILGIGLTAVALLMAITFAAPRILGQGANSTDPFIGTWKLNLAKSSSVGADGAPVHPTRTATRIVAVEGDGYRMTTSDDANPGAARSYFFRSDGKEYPDPHGPGRGEVANHWRPSPYVMVRLVKTNGTPTEWVTYAVSSDGNVLITTEWEPATPGKHMIQFYERQK
jgi:hypothetical protein